MSIFSLGYSLEPGLGLPAEPAALGSDLYSLLEGIAGIKSPSLPGSKNAGSNSENGAETKGLFSTSANKL